MQAIILAAGMGKRLGQFTANNTKCMVKVNGHRLIDSMLIRLKALNLNRIIIVTGYESENLKHHILNTFPDLPLFFINNPIYDQTNNIYSLWLARELMAEDDTLLLESDLIFKEEVLRKIMETSYSDCALVSKYDTWMDGTMVTIDDDSNIVNFIPKKAFDYSDTGQYYKTVNIYKFSKYFITNHYLPFLEAYIRVLGENEYYEQVLRVITLIDGVEIKAIEVDGQDWYEIDDVQDLRIAETIFASPKERLYKLQEADGGFWRYPNLLDLSHLTNPFFPSIKIKDEIKANFDRLLSDNPSGVSITSLLASKNSSLLQEYVVAGNDTQELTKHLLDTLPGKIGIVYPYYNEEVISQYSERLIPFFISNPDLHFSINELLEFYSLNPVTSLILSNPTNPAGRPLTQSDLEALLDWCTVKNIKLILDESSLDFSDKPYSLLTNEILNKFPILSVIKSTSECCGVPGLKIGFIASADIRLIEKLRISSGSGNINSFGEFFMQIFSKYEKDYIRSIKLFHEERKRLWEGLKKINYIIPLPSESNYILCRILPPKTAYALTLQLLSDFNILIKECSGSTGFQKDYEYVRISVGTSEENIRLLAALNTLMD